MASTKFSTTMALFLAVNLLFFSLTAAKPCGPKKQKHHKYPKPTPRPSFPPTVPTPTPFFPPTVPTPTPFFPPTVPTPTPFFPPTVPTPTPFFPPTVPTPTPFFPPTVPTPTPFFPPTVPTPSVPTPSVGKCPIDTLKLGVCANVLNGLINAIIGTPPKAPCCTLIQGLADLEAAVCLCTAIKANILGINLNLPISLSLLVNYCGGKVPRGFQCP